MLIQLAKSLHVRLEVSGIESHGKLIDLKHCSNRANSWPHFAISTRIIHELDLLKSKRVVHLKQAEFSRCISVGEVDLG